jgi:hypothetical protein
VANWGLSMTDKYVYFFVRSGPNGNVAQSRRRATLDAIRGISGEAVMDSQLVVDHTEVDDNGFVIGHSNSDSHPMDGLWSQIRSLERRAQSREDEALEMNDADQAQDRYMLSLESRELRCQAQLLRRQRMESMTAALGYHMDAAVFMQTTGPAPSNSDLLRD